MTLVYIGVFLMALGFALVSIYIAKILLKTSQTLTTIGSTADEVESKMDKTISEIEAVIVEVEQTAIDVEKKVVATNGVFLAIKDIGDATSVMTSQLEARTALYDRKGLLAGTQPFVSAIQFTEFGLGLVRSWHRGKSAR